jgi:hypothetical protein
VLIILCVLVVPGILDYLDRGNETGVSSLQVTPSPIAFPSVRILGQTESLKLIQTRNGIWALEGRATGKPLITDTLLKYSIQIVDGSEPLIWGVEWCAATEAILAQNMELISYTFILNGISIPLDQFDINDYYDDETQGYCLHRYTILMDWTPGSYLLKTITKFEQAVNDGWDEYPAFTRTTEYHITVTAESP